jgi:beta-glucosidase
VSPLLYGLLAKWGFNGHVTSDCGSIEDLVHSYKLAADQAEADAMSLKAGLNVRCGWDPSAVTEAVKRGLLSEAELNYRVGGLLRTMFRLGFFDPKEKVPFSQVAPSENNSPEHGALALKAARESLVLLKNDGTLPLAREKLKRVALIGPNANSVPVLLGNYNGKPVAPVTVLAGLQAALGHGVEVEYQRGCEHVTTAGGASLVPGANLDRGDNPGLKVEIFNEADFASKPVAAWDAEALAIDWPGEGRTAGVFAVRWTGNLNVFFAGDYELTLETQGGCRVYLNDKLVIDAWDHTGQGAHSFKRALKAGDRLPLRVEYKHTDGRAKAALNWTPPAAEAGFADAVAAAKRADAVIMVGGISASLEGEEMPVEIPGFKGGDRTAIELPDIQQRLLERLKATGRPVVFVNMSGSAIAMPKADEVANAILQAWYPGQSAGTAIADVLLGNYNPAGRLPLTFYRATTDLPPFENYEMAGRTYRYFKGKPLYAFGHGLSYTKFTYANLKVAPAANSTLAVTVDVTNAGARDGEEVVQLYAVPPAARENEALCGFKRITLKQGETKTVTITVPATALRRWSAEKKDYATPAGEWEVRAGASSSDIRQTGKVKL